MTPTAANCEVKWISRQNNEATCKVGVSRDRSQQKRVRNMVESKASIGRRHHLLLSSLSKALDTNYSLEREVIAK